MKVKFLILLIIFSVTHISCNAQSTIQKKSFVGKYETSDSSYCNPKIVININRGRKKGTFNFSLLSNTKKVSNGILKVNKNENDTVFILKNIAGLYKNDSIIIQNYGNSMNEFINFKKCGNKYVFFIKK